MKRDGLYTIGCRTTDKEGNPTDGFYVHGKYVPCCLSNLQKAHEGDRLIVIKTSEDAERYAQYLSRNYRYEFRKWAEKLEQKGVCSKEEAMRRQAFYPIKLTSSKLDILEFPDELPQAGMRLNSKYQFLGNRYNLTLMPIKVKRLDAAEQA